MKILDRYIIKKFLIIFLPTLFISTFLIGIIDFTNKNSLFLSNRLSIKQILEYYSSYIPYIVNFSIPFITFITVLFITTRLSRNNEITAILCSGRSFKRILATFTSAALLVSMLNFIMSNWILPKSINKKNYYENKLGLLSFSPNSKYTHIQFDTNKYLYIADFNPIKQTGKIVTIEKIINSELVEKYYAKEILWDTEKEKWILKDWDKKEFHANGEKITNGKILLYDLKLRPTDLELNPRLYSTLTLVKLHKEISNLKKISSNSLRFFISELHERYMNSFASLILTNLGVIISSSRSRNRSEIKISIGIALGFIYIAMYLFSKSYANAIGDNIAFIMWLPNVVFSIICLVLYRVKHLINF